MALKALALGFLMGVMAIAAIREFHVSIVRINIGSGNVPIICMARKANGRWCLICGRRFLMTTAAFEPGCFVFICQKRFF